MRQHRFLSGIIPALILSAVTLGQTEKPATPPPDNKPAVTAFSVTSLDGEKFELASLRGKVVVLNFWFTACEPCVAEMPGLNKLVDKFKDKDVVFIAPTWDNEATLRTFLKEHPFKYHVVPNAGKLAIDSSSDGAGHVVFPTHIVIDRDGKISAKMNGPQTLEDLSKAIERLANTPSEHAK